MDPREPESLPERESARQPTDSVGGRGLPSPEELLHRLDDAMIADRAGLRAKIRQLQRVARHHDHPDAPMREVREIEQAIDRSRARVESRRRSLPRANYPSDLPVAARRDEIMAAIRDHQVVVVCGATGSGKTTQLPKMCLDLGLGVRGMIGHTQPRRIAARAVAQRVAHELGQTVGQGVGFKVRFTDQVSDRSFVKLMTDGILLAETQGDRSLWRYDTLIVDEAHERSLNIDFLLGYLRGVLTQRHDLKIIITSATIDPDRFAAHFAMPGKPRPPVIEVSGRTYPVEVRYRSLAAASPEDDDRDIPTGVIDACDELARHDADSGAKAGDVLVFLPGEREIRETADALRKHFSDRSGPRARTTEILPLFARLSADEQQRIFDGHEHRRIVLATNVAETSLTVPGIRHVVDCGLARIGRYSPRVKVQRLPIEPISRASANQRAGRCGRTSPGVCIRLYSEDDFAKRQEFTDPEILRTNLASVILQMKALGLGEIDDFPFIEAPDARNVRDGFETLLELGAIEGGGLRHDLTAIGAKLARLPVDPRIGRMLIAAERERCLGDVLVIAAALSVPDPRERPMDKADQADAAHLLFRHERSDFLSFVNLWREMHKQERQLSGGGFRKWCREKFVSWLRFREWQDIHRQLESLLEELGVGGGAAGGSREINSSHERHFEHVHRALLSGLLSSIACKNAQNPFEYDGARGSKLQIFPGSGLFKMSPKWIMAAEVVKTTKTYGRTVAAISPPWIEQLAGHLVKRSFQEPHYDAETAQAMAYETVSLYGLEIIKRRRVPFGEVDPAASRTLFIHHALVGGEYLTNAKFFDHNHGLTKEVQALQEKSRTRDLLADQTTRHGFYDKRLPPEVVSGPSFEQWRRKAEAHAPGLLEMAPADVVAPGADLPTPEQFPDHLLVSDPSDASRKTRLSLTYKHDPAATDDGLTLTLPERVLPMLDPDQLEWLVPGLIKGKVVALIKGLSKNLRTALVPAPMVAERALAKMTFGKGKLSEALTDAIRSGASSEGGGSGLYVSPELWVFSTLDAHLRMNVRVVDDKGKVLVEGRELSLMRAHVDRRARDLLANLPAGPMNCGGVSVWGGWLGQARAGDEAALLAAELPVSYSVPWLGSSRTIYPALALEPDGRSVGVRPFDDPARAAAAARLGLRRLLAMQLRKEARSLIDTTPGIERLGVLYAPIGKGKELLEDLADLAGLLAFDDGFTPPGAPALARRAASGGGKGGSTYVPVPAEEVRTWPAFEARLNWGWDRLGACGRFGVETVRETLEIYQRVAMKLAEPATTPARQSAVADVRSQLEHLMPARVVRVTPVEQLRHMPRYLLAIERRFDKLLHDGGERDTRHIHMVWPFWRAYLTRVENAGGIATLGGQPALSTFRWLIEEYRVSVFAQELGSVGTVSIKRLEQAWAKVVEADQASAAASAGEPAPTAATAPMGTHKGAAERSAPVKK
jgi:ATP-dependent helicase HrpA